MDAVLNGKPILRIGKRGMMPVAFGDEGQEPVPPFQIDVALIHNQYLDLVRSWRNDKGVVPAEKHTELRLATRDFVIALTKSTDHPNGYAEMSLSESEGFISLLCAAAEELILFFQPKSSEKPSSQGSTELRFSET